MVNYSKRLRIGADIRKKKKVEDTRGSRSGIEKGSGRDKVASR